MKTTIKIDWAELEKEQTKGQYEITLKLFKDLVKQLGKKRKSK